LAAGTTGLTDAIALLRNSAGLRSDEHVLVVVDQFEELFNETAEELRQRFVDTLLHARQDPSANLHVLVTLRKDFYERCFDYGALATRIGENQLNVVRMGEAQLREAIEKPASLAGLTIEPGLADALVRDLGVGDGRLPLLEFALYELWRERRDGKLSHDAYRKIGRLDGALRQYAEKEFEALADARKPLARQLFVELTRVGRDNSEDTKRRRSRRELVAVLGTDAGAVLDALVDKRLLTAGGDGSNASHDATVEVVHETLIREWTRCKAWIDADRADLRIREQLEDFCQEWRKERESPRYLYPEKRLPEIEEWAARHAEDLEKNAGLSRFVRASIAARDWAQQEMARLSDAETLRDLLERADELWPALPDRAQAMTEWLAEAGPLARELGVHQDALSKLRERGRRTTARDGAETWSFDDKRDAGWHRSLQALIDDLESFAHPERGLIDGTHPEHGLGIAKRFALANSVEERTVAGEGARRWAKAIESIAARAECPLYRGLRLQPQLGLLPLGRCVHSGLWEFAHVLSGDEVATWDDRLGGIVTERSGLVLVLVPGGTFLQGAQREDRRAPGYDPDAEPDEGRPHEVTLAPFFLSKYAMTQSQWQWATGSNPSVYKPGSRFGDKVTTGLHPVENVSWVDCERWLQRMGLLLPTESQWEYAARAGTATPWWTGAERESLADAANLADAFCKRNGGPAGWNYESWDDGYAIHAPVIAYRPNPFGLFGVHGNVWEWCRDAYGRYDASEAREGDGLREPAGSASRVGRGGSFGGAASDARSANRNAGAPEYRDGNLGLRPARGITP
jgi:formylglycine-generating enzyme required for sulfatase activity